MIKANIIGLDALQRKISNAPKQIQEEVSAELQVSAWEFRDMAKRDLAEQGGDRGTLLRSITAQPIGPLTWEISANAFYAPFIEFGTKAKFNPYPGTEEFAAQYKGAKGTGALKLIDAIKGWVDRKGIATGKEIDRVAFLIARSIYKTGISPKPFFFKQVTPVRENLYKRLNNIFNGI